MVKENVTKNISLAQFDKASYIEMTFLLFFIRLKMKNHQKEETYHLQRNLQNRHLQLIAIGGAIGTGLFLGAGKTINAAGPSVIFTYLIIGFFLFFIMRAMGEILLSDLKYKSFIDFTYDILGEKAGFFIGWTYWFCWVVLGMADIIAITSYIQEWWPNVPLWLPALSCIVLMAGSNMLTVKLFGEMEFWFALIKIIAIISLIGVGIWLVSTNFINPSTGHSATINNLWNLDGGIFPKGIKGFFAAFQIAFFAFVGIELVGTAAAETHNPYTNLPKAINRIPIRIIIFYVFALTVIMTVTPWYKVSPEKSPFVNMFQLIGLSSAAIIINAVVLSSALSSANSGVFSTGRMLYGLAQEHAAPKVFGKLSRNGVPAAAIMYSCAFLFFPIFLLYQNQNGGVMQAFTIVTTISSIGFIFVWGMILCVYIRYRKIRPQMHAQSKFKMPGGVVMAYICLAFLAGVLCLFSLEKDTLTGMLYTPIWFIILIFFYFYHHGKNPKK